MRSRLAQAVVVASSVIVASGTIGAAPSSAQTQVTSLEALRRQLTAGDAITIVPDTGPPVAGRLIRVGTDDIEIRPGKRTPGTSIARDVTIPLTTILSLERPRDSARNGAAIGAGIGAGVGGAMFLTALAVDRNEIDEWAGFYAGTTAVFTGIGAVIGWAVDAARSKPHIRFDASSKGKTKVSLGPVYSRNRRLAVIVSISR